MLPQQVGRYEVVGRLGRGGMGEVFEGFDPQLERRVALKRLATTAPEEHRDRLRREALSVAALSNPATPTSTKSFRRTAETGSSWSTSRARPFPICS